VGVWRAHGSKDRMLSAAFPGEPGLECDMWCFETAGIDYQGGERLDSGGVQLRYSWEGHSEWLRVTMSPEPGAVDITVRLVSSKGQPVTDPSQECPALNICWQLLRAPLFCSWPDPYPEFIKRCFLFTDDGCVFLDQTPRFPIPVRAADDPYNNPPWVQAYLPVWRPFVQAGPDSWASFSTTRYIYPVIGVTSRDGRYLAAIATESSTNMCQAWHDCLHNNAEWLPAPEGGKQWRWRTYIMPNDPGRLLEAVAHDMPGAMAQQSKRIPA